MTFDGSQIIQITLAIFKFMFVVLSVYLESKFFCC